MRSFAPVWGAVWRLAALVALMFVGVVAVNALPRANVEAMLARFVAQEQERPSSRWLHPEIDYDICITGGIGIPDHGDGLVRRALLSPAFKECSGFLEYRKTGEGTHDYWRFWHGFQIVSRPLLTFGSVRALKAFVLALFLGTAAHLVYQLMANRLPASALSVVVASLFVPMPLRNSAPGVIEGLIWSIAFLSGGWFVRLSRRGETISVENGAFVFLLLGALTIFVDWFTIPLTTVLVPLLCLLWCVDDRRSLVVSPYPLVVTFLVWSAVWFTGYMVTWGSKWLLVLLATEESFENVSSQILYRVSGVQGTWWDSLRANLSEILPGLIVTTAVGLFGWLWGRRSKDAAIVTSPETLAAGTIFVAAPIAFVVLLRQHSIAHAWYNAAIFYSMFAFTLSLSFQRLAGRFAPLIRVGHRVDAAGSR